MHVTSERKGGCPSNARRKGDAHEFSMQVASLVCSGPSA